ASFHATEDEDLGGLHCSDVAHLGSILTTRRIVMGISWLLLAGCAGATAPPHATTPTSSSPVTSVQEVDVGGYRLEIECEGEGSPTVVFEAGAGSDRAAFWYQVDDLGEVTRVCAYDRAGIGASDPRPATGSVALGDLADELARVLGGAGIEEPIVLASHSLGGGVAQFFAGRYPDRVVGLLFVDTVAIPGYVDWFGPEVDDGTGGTIDMARTAEEWRQLGSLGSIPTFVLTQNFQGDDDVAPPRFRRYFLRVHDALAGRSSDAVHVIAVDSGHVIQDTAPDLVSAALMEVVDAVRSGEGLTPCDDRFEDLGGACA
ncbi:MAG: alpha/beta fold hydrolase, partial [Actinomycetota bacterium]